MWKTALKVVVLIVALGSAASEANAFGHHGWGGCGWRGCGNGGCGAWGPCGWGGCGYGVGYYGGWGYRGWGYSGWRYGGLGYPGYIGPGFGFVVVAAPRATTMAPPAIASESALLTIEVPADAKIYVNEHLTTSTGAVRQYRSRGLKPGATYQYKVRAEFVRDNRPVSEEKTIQLTAGRNVAIDFTGTQPQVAEVAMPPRR